MNSIKLWWKTQVLKQVVFKEDGFTPYDCKGLQIVKGKPFEEGAEYIIDPIRSSNYFDYFGEGDYVTHKYGCYSVDVNNPYTRKNINNHMLKYKDFNLNNKEVYLNGG